MAVFRSPSLLVNSSLLVDDKGHHSQLSQHRLDRTTAQFLSTVCSVYHYLAPLPKTTEQCPLDPDKRGEHLAKLRNLEQLEARHRN